MDFNQIKRHTENFALYNGPEKVVQKTVEECVELLRELTVESKNPDKIKEETADVIIMCLQLMHTYGFNSIKSMVEYKIHRQQKRINLGIRHEIDLMGHHISNYIANPAPVDDYFGE